MTNVGLERVGINDLETRMELLRPIMVKSSQLALKLFEDRGELKVEEKSARDYVSDADFKFERHIRELIAKELPHDMVIGEELGGVAGSKYWIIDPIDGTSNYLSGLPMWGISVAYVVAGEPVIGAIAMPALGQLVCGDTMRGLDSASRALRQKGTAPRVFGVGRNGNWNAKDRITAETFVEEAGFHPINLGSCSTMLAYCVLGQLAGYIEAGIGFWDCAAGVALCKAAQIDVCYSSGDGVGSARVACGPMGEYLKLCVWRSAHAVKTGHLLNRSG